MMNHIIEQISTIPQLTLKNRIKNELEILMNISYLNSDSYVNIKQDKCDKSDQIIYRISFYNINDYNFYELILPINYPFRPPKLNINYRKYFDYLKINSLYFREALVEYKNIRCFCCKTILCGNNWSPTYKFKDIIDEIVKFKGYCKEISQIIIINVIKRKYLINDINIIEWL